VTTAAEIDALVASGATVEMIAAMFKANLAEKEKARAKRRAGQNARQTRCREPKTRQSNGGPNAISSTRWRRPAASSNTSMRLSRMKSHACHA
jgi:hypothetical protein